MNEAIEALRETLKSNGSSLTAPREAVFLTLLDQEPQTLSDIAKRLTGKVDRASVYRTIDLFEKLGIITRLQLGWKYKLELSDHFAAHHHHMTCTNCGQIIEIDAKIKALYVSLGLAKTPSLIQIHLQRSR